MKLLIIVFFYFLSTSNNCVNSKNWDYIIEKYYPTSNLYEHIFGTRQPRNNDCSADIAVTSRDIDISIKHAKKLYDKFNEIEERASRECFPSKAIQIFFSALPSQDISESSKLSKEILLSTKLLQKTKLNTYVTPNTFLDFLENNKCRMKIKMDNNKLLRSHVGEPHSPIRSYDGSNNNILNPLWGSALTPYTRIAQENYNDGLFEMPKAKSGNCLPSPRILSNTFFMGTQKYSNILSNMVVFWGQFVAHDLSLRTMEQCVSGGIQCCSQKGCFEIDPDQRPSACAPINIAPDDPFYSREGIRCLNFVRSITAPTIDNVLGAAQQMNIVSHFLDGSPIYSSKTIYANKLRTFENGKLELTSKNFLPSSPDPKETCDNINTYGQCPCYLAGDVRVNQTPSLVAIHTILAREHNRIADKLQLINPHWDDEKLFQETRKIVIAEIQHITYHEWLPLCLGEKYLRQHKICTNGLYSYDYDYKINPSILNEFATAAFRSFHMLINGRITVCTTENRHKVEHSRLSHHLLSPYMIEFGDNGLESILRGILNEPTMAADGGFSSEVRNYLFKSTNNSGIDLASIDIQRNRDHGLGSYNTYRSICGLKKALTFNDLSKEISYDKIKLLKSVYEHVDDIDLFVGGSMEKKVEGSILGPTFQCIVGEQFYRTKVGDRYFYDSADMPHSFSHDQLLEIKKISLARIICDNSNIENVQLKAFEIVGKNNPLHKCNNTYNLPTLNLEYWKENQCSQLA